MFTASRTKFRQENDTFGRNLLKLCICNNILQLKLVMKHNISHGIGVSTYTHTTMDLLLSGGLASTDK
jgi:hypothetical protein